MAMDPAMLTAAYPQPLVDGVTGDCVSLAELTLGIMLISLFWQLT